MSFFASFKKRDNYSLIFNIGSGSVIGSLVKVTEKTGVDVLCYTKEQIPFEQNLSPEKYMANLKIATTKVGEKLHTEGVKKINHGLEKPIKIYRSYYLFSNPWCTSQTKTFKIRENKPVKLSDKYINSLIQKQEPTTPAGEKLIENHIVQVKINGYVLNKFENIKTKEAEISFMTSFAMSPET